jgi:hypothetical protein
MEFHFLFNSQAPSLISIYKYFQEITNKNITQNKQKLSSLSDNLEQEIFSDASLVQKKPTK